MGTVRVARSIAFVVVLFGFLALGGTVRTEPRSTATVAAQSNSNTATVDTDVISGMEAGMHTVLVLTGSTTHSRTTRASG